MFLKMYVVLMSRSLSSVEEGTLAGEASISALASVQVASAVIVS